MEVNPTPPATPSYSVLLAPEATMNPTMPLMAPERNMVRIITRPTFMPAYRAVLTLSPMTAIS